MDDDTGKRISSFSRPLFPRRTLIATFCTVIKDLFAAVEEKNGGKLTPDQVSRVSLKLGEMLGNPDSHEVAQNEKGQVRHISFFHLPVIRIV